MGVEGEGSGVKGGGKWGLGTPLSTPSDKMSHNAGFHQGLHCLLRQYHIKGKKYNIFGKYYM